MAKTNIWMPFYIGDYLADTTGLTTEQHGTYMLLIFAYWTNRGPLPDDNDEFARITRLMPRAWLAHRHRIAKFFRIECGLWHHARIDKEMERVTLNNVSRSQAGKKAANARWSDASRNATAMPPQPQPDKVPPLSAREGKAVLTEESAPPVLPKRQERTNSPDLAAAQAHFAAVNLRMQEPDYEPKCEPFSVAEVTDAWMSLEATKDESGQWWWGRRPVGDWPAAMHARIASQRKEQHAKRNTNTNSGPTRGEDTRDHAAGF